MIKNRKLIKSINKDLINELNLKIAIGEELEEHSVHLGDGFFCLNCHENYLRENKTDSYVEDEIDQDLLGFNLNPEMDEESCYTCFKKKKYTSATCIVNGILVLKLIKGQPSCFDCATSKKNIKLQKKSSNDLNTITQMFNETTQMKTIGRTNSLALFSSGISKVAL